MGKAYGRLAAALAQVGARLKRGRKHWVYELPNGRNFVVAKSPGDVRAEDNALSDLSAVAGVDVRPRPKKATPDVRAERRARPGRAGEAPWKPSMSGLSEALRSAGIVEQQLRTELDALRAAVKQGRDYAHQQMRLALDEAAREREAPGPWWLRWAETSDAYRARLYRRAMALGRAHAMFDALGHMPSIAGEAESEAER